MGTGQEFINKVDELGAFTRSLDNHQNEFRKYIEAYTEGDAVLEDLEYSMAIVTDCLEETFEAVKLLTGWHSIPFAIAKRGYTNTITISIN